MGLTQFGKELSNDVLEKLSIGDLSPVSQLILELKKEIETKDRLLFDKEQNCLIKDNELINLQKKLDEEKIANNELLTSFDNKTKGIREQKDKLEIECKNQQTTIYNLREVLEATAKRNNGNNVTSSNDIMINVLSEQLSDFFGENMKKEKQLDLFKDEILELKSKIFEMNQDYICLEKRYKNHTDNQECNQENLKKSRKKTLKNGSNLDNTITEKLHKKTNSDYILLRKDLELFNEQTRDILFQDHQITRITNILTAMDIHCKKQQIHYSKIINELSEELASLSDQLVASQQQEELMKGTAALEESIVEIEEHNDMLKKTIETYDIQLADAEHQLDTITQQNSTLKKHVTELKNELEDKEKLIYNLKLENEKYIMEINLQKSLCHCNHQSSSSTDSDRNSYNNSRMKNLQETVSQKTMDSFRAMDKIQKLTNELQKQQKSFTEEKSRLLNEHSDLVGTIGKLKSKISMVEMTIVKKDNELTKMNAKLIDFAQRENDLQTELLKKSDRLTQLEHEDYKLREVVDDLSHEVADAKTELKRREFKIINELETIKQTKVKFETNADTLEKQNEKLQQQIDILIKENGALKIDGQKLKEKLAVLEGRENTLGELFKANLDKITFQNKELNRLSVSEKNFQLAKENNKRLIGHNTELLKKYQTLQKDYVIIRDEYKNLLEVKEQALFALETARKWQNEHSEREKIVSLKIFKQNEHIRTLLDDRKLLIAKINEMHRDILILTDELDKYKDSQSGWQCDQLGNNNLFLPFRETYSRSSKITRYNSDPELNDMELKKIREVTQRIYRTRKYFENGLRESIN